MSRNQQKDRAINHLKAVLNRHPEEKRYQITEDILLELYDIFQNRVVMKDQNSAQAVEKLLEKIDENQ